MFNAANARMEIALDFCLLAFHRWIPAQAVGLVFLPAPPKGLCVAGGGLMGHGVLSPFEGGRGHSRQVKDINI